MLIQSKNCFCAILELVFRNLLAVKLYSMVALSFALDVILVLVLQCCLSARAQSHGDVRLVGSKSNNLGRVQVFFRSQWSTICDRNYAGGADTVCYQLNHTHSSRAHPGTSTKLMNESLKKVGMPQIDHVTSDMPIAMMDLDCGAIYSTPLVTTHILQCTYKSLENGSACSHDDDLAVFCDLEPEKPYNSEVRLVGGNFSSIGTLEVYLEKQWGNVCFQGFQQTTANTVCRQLGYTHAQHFIEMKNSTAGVVWLKDITCKIPQPCLNGCFGKHKLNPTTTCPDGAYVALQCSFEPERKGSTRDFFGNAIMCSLQRQYSKTPAYFVAILSVSSVFWIVTSAAIIVVAVCCSVKSCPCYKLKKRNQYMPIN